MLQSPKNREVFLFNSHVLLFCFVVICKGNSRFFCCLIYNIYLWSFYEKAGCYKYFCVCVCVFVYWIYLCVYMIDQFLCQHDKCTWYARKFLMQSMCLVKQMCQICNRGCWGSRPWYAWSWKWRGNWNIC